MNRTGEWRGEGGAVYTKTFLAEGALDQEITYLEGVFRGWGAKGKELVSIRDLFVGEQVDAATIKQVENQVPLQAYGLNIESNTLKTFYTYLIKLIGCKKPGDPGVYDNADLRDSYKLIVQRVVTRSNMQSKSLTLGLFKDFCDSVLGFVRELRETGVAYPQPLPVESPKPEAPPTFIAPPSSLRAVSANSGQGGWYRYKERDKIGYVPTLYEATFYLDSKERLVGALYKMLENSPTKVDAPHADFSDDEYFLALFERVDLDQQCRLVNFLRNNELPPYAQAPALVFLFAFLRGKSKHEIVELFNNINPFKEYALDQPERDRIFFVRFEKILSEWGNNYGVPISAR